MKAVLLTIQIVFKMISLDNYLTVMVSLVAEKKEHE